MLTGADVGTRHPAGLPAKGNKYADLFRSLLGQEPQRTGVSPHTGGRKGRSYGRKGLKMKVLVCGGRDFKDKACVFDWLNRIHEERGPITQLIEGGAKGADRLAYEWSKSRNIETRRFEADWSHGRKAGPLRNAKMLEEGSPDLVVAFPGGAGTADMVRRAQQAKVKTCQIG